MYNLHIDYNICRTVKHGGDRGRLISELGIKLFFNSLTFDNVT